MKCQHCGSEVFFLSVASGEPRFCCTRCGQTHFHKPADVVGRLTQHSLLKAPPAQMSSLRKVSKGSAERAS
jgi:hypothetical protein